MNVGEYIKKLRTEKGITQEELGTIIGVQRAAVQKWESGKTQNLKRTTIQKLADYFDVNPVNFVAELDGIEYEFPAWCANIKKARKKLDLTLEEVASKVDVSKQTIQRYESGVIQNIPIDKIEKLSNALNMDPVVLMGLKDPTPAETKPQTIERDFIDFSKLVKIPILGEIRCGEPMYAEGNIEGYAYADEDSLNSGYRYFYLKAKGDSMINAGISPGDLLLIRAQSDVDSGDIAVVNVNGDEETLKRVIKKKDTIILQPENPISDTIIFFQEEINNIHIQGRLMQVIKKY